MDSLNINSLVTKLDLILDELPYRILKEFQFAKPRKFRADYFLIDHNIIIEYQGISYRGWAGHQSPKGLLRDIEKHNLALSLGFTTIYLNHTHINDTQHIENLIKKVIEHFHPPKM